MYNDHDSHVNVYFPMASSLAWQQVSLVAVVERHLLGLTEPSDTIIIT